jgi:hypothetical protein
LPGSGRAPRSHRRPGTGGRPRWRRTARQELRALLADPAAGFAALPGDEFFAALKQACQDGTANLALIAEYERRITSGEAGPRELH